MEQHAWHAMDEAQQRVFFEHHDDAEIHSPKHEIPTRTVPKTRQEPHGKDVE